MLKNKVPRIHWYIQKKYLIGLSTNLEAMP